VQLAAAVARDEHEVVEFSRHRPHVQEDNILPAVVLGRACRGQRELFASLLADVDRSGSIGDGGDPRTECGKRCGPILTVWPPSDEGTAEDDKETGDTEKE
jgi:hypothetical protein